MVQFCYMKQYRRKGERLGQRRPGGPKFTWSVLDYLKADPGPGLGYIESRYYCNSVPGSHLD